MKNFCFGYCTRSWNNLFLATDIHQSNVEFSVVHVHVARLKNFGGGGICPPSLGSEGEAFALPPSLALASDTAGPANHCIVLKKLLLIYLLVQNLGRGEGGGGEAFALPT